MDSIYEYRGYTLDISKYDLSDSEKAVIDNAADLVDYGWSLRTLSENCGVSRSKLQKDFATTLRYVCYELYQLVQKQYSINRPHTKG